MNKRNYFIAEAAVIAALYVVLTLISAAFGLDKNVIQFRISEALTVLPFYSAAAIPGLFVGCFFSNIFFGAIPIDVIFGTLATFIGALGTYFIGKKVKIKWLAPIPPIFSNTFIVPLILKYAYHIEGSFVYFMLTVFIGEFVCCGIIGTIFSCLIFDKIFKNKIC